MDTAHGDGSAPLRRADPQGLAAAVAAVDGGRLIGLPTETVYGLAGDALSSEVVAAIFAAKSRPADNPLIVHVAAAEELARLTPAVSPLARDLAAAHWPGPLTLVVTASASVPAITRAGLSTVAVRVPDHPVATAVLERCRSPLAAPSANRSGRPSPTTAEHVLEEFGREVALVLDGGPCVIGVESTVVDARGTHPVVLREGAVTREQLGVTAEGTGAEQHRSPGTRYRHYAPRCRIALIPAAEVEVALASAGAGQGQHGAIVRRGHEDEVPDTVRLVATFTDAADLARQLYAAFRAAEEGAVEQLLVETVDEEGVGRAVMDRLRRAAGPV
ncbi:MAG: L-threonylcarbamoyladenylate synthase [Nitriliruptoraceae bacterium]